jgi:hypothetical protein
MGLPPRDDGAQIHLAAGNQIQRRAREHVGTTPTSNDRNKFRFGDEIKRVLTDCLLEVVVRFSYFVERFGIHYSTIDFGIRFQDDF